MAGPSRAPLYLVPSLLPPLKKINWRDGRGGEEARK